MKYYRYISETQIEPYDKGYVVVDGKQISNPSAETLLKAGIKPLTEDEKPAHDENTQYLEWTFENKETEIAVHWKVIEVVHDESAEA